MKNIVSKRSREEEAAIELLKKYIQSWEKTENHNKEDIDQMYDFFKKNCKPDCPSDIIDIGYCLSDIYDKQSKYEKSLEITKQILYCFELSKAKEELIYDKKYIRKVIGCAYGLATAEVESDAEKNDLLKQSKKLFRKAEELCGKYSNSIFSRFYDKEFLWWLYHSDYGTFLLNRGEINAKRQDDIKARRAYISALEEFKHGLEHKEALSNAIKNYNDTYQEMEYDIKKILAVNKHGTGIALFKLGRYKDSIKEHEDALEIYSELKDKDGEIRTKKNIIEGTIKLWENNHGDLDREKFEIYKKYLINLKNYGVKGIKDICKKMKEIEDSFHDE